ncbi:TPA: helix-turn-helix domain-containing protein [Pseudomonas putida]|jgi:transcriptional regulator with XRE-family HTH domain|uniref:Transcriptional regulator, XRE family n=1 Tax=Pseudomonas putida (strain GB-1) TaxID=76869 RepID=B0KHG2_PSEPG|nr:MULTISPECIES: helix-turn-helix domain-containing protein [Pseudomonas]ABY99044.1 transcriptional regulator, XRE family [Pseudomonas putida GB-1]APE99279.1 transcriptional regulator [Pseudomonas putida]MBP0708747.1 helix-turn-helix transcriptional regulator [Pseudomonas sp. T34]MCE1000971.1 helix-turn-helix transcriptional regulator [Pseudomonas sp. NMI1173_11]MCK2188185.1 helix-turn-helix transcriptional regulator [Pseudomonas sp. MB04B]
MNQHLFHRNSPAPHTSAGQHLRHLRRQASLSQLDLALLAGLSQRHLSCVETGRARASPSTLHALLSALGAPLELCNEVFVAAGYAPRYAASPLDAPELALVHAAIEHILQVNNPAPAIVIDSNWDVIAANTSTGLLLAMAGVTAQPATGLNLLQTLLCPGGLGDHLANAQEIRSAAWQRASREAAGNPALAERLGKLPIPGSPLETAATPVLLTRVHSPYGELRFLSTFTTFGMPLDITVESLRIEHLIPADPQTRQRMQAAFEQWSAVTA